MGPVKALLPLAKGFLRLAVMIFAFVYYFDVFRGFNVHAVEWFVGTSFIVFGLLLFVGGFASSPVLSVISGFVIFGLSCYEIFIRFKGLETTICLFLYAAAIGLYFVARGNRG